MEYLIGFFGIVYVFVFMKSVRKWIEAREYMIHIAELEKSGEKKE